MSLVARLRTGLSKSSGKLTDGITGIFTRRKLDAEALSQLEELLIEADMGPKTAASITAALSQRAFDKDVDPETVKEALAEEIAVILQKVAKPFAPEVLHKPAVVLVVGVNGSGKTTTIGKLAAKFKSAGHKVTLAAADTFRAAAVEQLQEWANRSHIPLITGAPESDPASVAYKAYEQAKADQVDILLIDTAGRLHNKANLMQELQKISNVLKKIDAGAPHYVIQVLDATIGQNTVAQVQAFNEMVPVSGLIVTKLDGTAKGGVIVALAGQLGLPVHMIGLGEGIEDLGAFEPIEFSRNLVGLTS